MARLAHGLSICCALALLTAQPALAAWPAGGIEFEPSCCWQDIRLLPRAGGGFIIPVTSRVSSQGGGISELLVDADGTFGQTTFITSLFPGCAQGENWSVARSSTEHPFHALANQSGSPADIILYRAAPGWSWPGPLVQSPSLLEQSPVLAPDGAGGVFVAWWRGDMQLRMTRVLEDAQIAPGWPADGLIIDPSTAAFFFTSHRLHADGAGGVIVAWLDDSVRVQRWTATGMVAPGWPAAGRTLNTVPPDWVTALPSLNLVPSGNAHVIVTWEDAAQPTRRIMAMRVGFDGVRDPAWPVGGTVVVENSARTISGVVAHPDGAAGVIVVWPDPSGPMASRVLVDGTRAAGWPTAGKTLLPVGAAYAGSFAAMAGPSNGLVFAWDDSATGRIRWVRGDGTPDPGTPANGVEIHPGSATPARILTMASDQADGAYVCWWEPSASCSAVDLTPAHMTLHPYPATTEIPGSPLRTTLALGVPRPNPSRGTARVTLTLAPGAPASLELLDVGGRVARSQPIEGEGELSIEVTTRGLRAGVYFLRLTQGAASRGRRLVIID